jgi:hypothetical protein
MTATAAPVRTEARALWQIERHLYTIKWIMWWTLVIVPIAALGLGALVAVLIVGTAPAPSDLHYP